MPSAVAKCPNCGYIAEFRHVHTPAYPDLPQTHMVGSERFICTQCQHSIGYLDDGARLFTFVLDKKKE